MSLHKSLRRKDELQRRRNVLSRSERIERLKAEEEWDPEEMSVFGLPKIKTQVVTAPRARRREEEEAEVPEGLEGAVEGEAGEEAASEQ